MDIVFSEEENQALIAKRDELARKINEVEQKLAEQTAAALAEDIQTAQELIAKHGLKPADLFVKTPRAVKATKAGTGVKLAAKYRGDSGEEWSGRGLTPKWMRAALEQGRKKEEFAVA